MLLSLAWGLGVVVLLQLPLQSPALGRPAVKERAFSGHIELKLRFVLMDILWSASTVRGVLVWPPGCLRHWPRSQGRVETRQPLLLGDRSGFAARSAAEALAADVGQ